jgi:hypothetical protein
MQELGGDNPAGSRAVQQASQYLGVYRLKKGLWTARISINSTTINLGSYKTQILAAKAYDEAAIKNDGKKAVVNFKISLAQAKKKPLQAGASPAAPAPPDSSGIVATHQRKDRDPQRPPQAPFVNMTREEFVAEQLKQIKENEGEDLALDGGGSWKINGNAIVRRSGRGAAVHATAAIKASSTPSLLHISHEFSPQVQIKPKQDRSRKNGEAKKEEGGEDEGEDGGEDEEKEDEEAEDEEDGEHEEEDDDDDDADEEEEEEEDGGGQKPRYRGVSKVGKRWLARCTHQQKLISLGYYNTPEAAAAAYNAGAKKYHGASAIFNTGVGMVTKDLGEDEGPAKPKKRSTTKDAGGSNIKKRKSNTPKGAPGSASKAPGSACKAPSSASKSKARSAGRSGSFSYSGGGSGSGSQYRGVRRVGEARWLARITLTGQQTHLGYFDTENDAARAYDEAAFASHGERAKPNFEDYPLGHAKKKYEEAQLEEEVKELEREKKEEEEEEEQKAVEGDGDADAPLPAQRKRKQPERLMMTVAEPKDGGHCVGNDSGPSALPGGSSGDQRYRGTAYIEKSGRWRSSIVVCGKPRHLGMYATGEDAACAYDMAALRFHGTERAKPTLNFGVEHYMYLDFVQQELRKNEHKNGSAAGGLGEDAGEDWLLSLALLVHTHTQRNFRNGKCNGHNGSGSFTPERSSNGFVGRSSSPSPRRSPHSNKQPEQYTKRKGANQYTKAKELAAIAAKQGAKHPNQYATKSKHANQYTTKVKHPNQYTKRKGANQYTKAKELAALAAAKRKADEQGLGDGTEFCWPEGYGPSGVHSPSSPSYIARGVERDKERMRREAHKQRVRAQREQQQLHGGGGCVLSSGGDGTIALWPRLGPVYAAEVDSQSEEQVAYFNARELQRKKLYPQLPPKVQDLPEQGPSKAAVAVAPAPAPATSSFYPDVLRVLGFKMRVEEMQDEEMQDVPVGTNESAKAHAAEAEASMASGPATVAKPTADSMVAAALTPPPVPAEPMQTEPAGPIGGDLIPAAPTPPTPPTTPTPEPAELLQSLGLSDREQRAIGATAFNFSANQPKRASKRTIYPHEGGEAGGTTNVSRKQLEEEEWSAEDKLAFHEGILRYGKQFRLLSSIPQFAGPDGSHREMPIGHNNSEQSKRRKRQQKSPKGVKQLVEFFYAVYKPSSRYKVWKAKQRLEAADTKDEAVTHRTTSNSANVAARAFEASLGALGAGMAGGGRSIGGLSSGESSARSSPFSPSTPTRSGLGGVPVNRHMLHGIDLSAHERDLLRCAALSASASAKAAQHNGGGLARTPPASPGGRSPRRSPATPRSGSGGSSLADASGGGSPRRSGANQHTKSKHPNQYTKRKGANQYTKAKELAAIAVKQGVGGLKEEEEEEYDDADEEEWDYDESDHDSDSEEYCVCRGSGSGYMVACLHCEGWFHGVCTGLGDGGNGSPQGKAAQQSMMRFRGTELEFICASCCATYGHREAEGGSAGPMLVDPKAFALASMLYQKAQQEVQAEAKALAEAKAQADAKAQVETAKMKADAAKTAEAAVKLEEKPAAQPLLVGQVVAVEPRTTPGQNKLGGVARIMSVNTSPSLAYGVKYVLGGTENAVPARFVHLHDVMKPIKLDAVLAETPEVGGEDGSPGGSAPVVGRRALRPRRQDSSGGTKGKSNEEGNKEQPLPLARKIKLTDLSGKVLADPASDTTMLPLASRRVPLWNRHAQRVIAGNAAPKVTNLAQFLRENQHCEVFFERKYTSKRSKQRKSKQAQQALLQQQQSGEVVPTKKKRKGANQYTKAKEFAALAAKQGEVDATKPATPKRKGANQYTKAKELAALAAKGKGNGAASGGGGTSPRRRSSPSPRPSPGWSKTARTTSAAARAAATSSAGNPQVGAGAMDGLGALSALLLLHDAAVSAPGLASTPTAGVAAASMLPASLVGASSKRGGDEKFGQQVSPKRQKQKQQQTSASMAGIANTGGGSGAAAGSDASVVPVVLDTKELEEKRQQAIRDAAITAAANKVKQETEDRLERAMLEAKRRAQKEAAERAARKIQAERQRQQMEEKAKRDAVQRARQAVEEQARKEVEAVEESRRQAAEQAKRLAEEQARWEAEERTRKAEERARQEVEAAEHAKRLAAKTVAEEQARTLEEQKKEVVLPVPALSSPAQLTVPETQQLAPAPPAPPAPPPPPAAPAPPAPVSPGHIAERSEVHVQHTLVPAPSISFLGDGHRPASP